MHFDVSDNGKLIGRVLSEALPGGTLPEVSSRVIVSEPAANGLVTVLNMQQVGQTRYFDAAGFPGRTGRLVDNRVAQHNDAVAAEFSRLQRQVVAAGAQHLGGDPVENEDVSRLVAGGKITQLTMARCRAPEVCGDHDGRALDRPSDRSQTGTFAR
jgi:hypothetical protein